MKTLYASLLSIFLFISPAWATTYYVAKTGSNSNTCSQAQSTATPKLTITGASGGMACLVAAGSLGHTLYIRTGTYSEFIDGSIDTVPTGTSYSNAPVIASYPGEVATLTQPAVSGGNIILFLYSSYLQYVIFKDLVLDGGYQNVKVGITGTTHHIKFDNIEAKNAWHQCVSWQVNTHDNWWHGGKVHHCGFGEAVASAGYPFYVGGQDQLIENVEVYDSQSYCVHIYDSNVPPQRVTMRGGLFHECALSRPQSSAILEKGTGNLIAYNVVYASTGHGILTYVSTNANVLHNTVYGSAQQGIYIYPGTTGATVKNNIVYLNSGGSILNSGTSTTLANNLTTDPSFTNASTHDFTLTTGSAAIDAGGAINGFAYNGSAPDIGRYETFKCNASGTVSGNLADITCGMNLNTPVVAGTGLRALLAGVARNTVSTAVLAGTDSVLRVTFDGAAAIAGGVWTSDTTGTITITDSTGQKALASTAISITNAAGAGTPDTFTPVASTTFTGSENPLRENGGWSANMGLLSGREMAKVSGIATYALSNGQDAGSRYSGASFSANQYGKCDITVTGTGGGGQGMGISLLNSASDNTHYRFIIDHAASNNAEIARVVAGTYTSLIRWTQAFADGDTFSFANNGAVLYVYDKTTSLVKTYDDTSGGGPTTGVPGIFYSSTETSASVDNCTFGNFSNAPTPTPTGTYTQKETRFYQAFYSNPPTNTTVTTVGSLSGNITMTRPNLSFALVTQLDCTVGDCDPVGLRLRYSRNGGPYLEVPDTLGADQIAFFGFSNDPTVLTGSVSCCLSGALTANAGTTQATSAATPIIDLAQNASTVNRRVLTLGGSAVATDTYDFREYSQTGAALTAYTVTPRITVGSTSLSVPGSFTTTGNPSNTNVILIWAPVTDTDFAGYRVYRGTSPGVYGSTPVCNNTIASVALTHSSITSCNLTMLTAGTYYFIVRSVDTGGNQSAASSEITKVITGFTARTTR